MTETESVNIERSLPTRGICYYMPGIFATHQGIAGLDQHLRKIYKEVRVYNSSVSADGLDRQRFDRIGTLLISDIERAKVSGEMIDLVGHSQGSTDIIKAFQAIEKQKPHFFQDPENLKHLHIILFGPSGFYKGVKGALEYLRRIKDFLQSDTQIGIASLNLVLPADIQAKALSQALAMAIQGSQHTEAEIPVETLTHVKTTTGSEDFKEFKLRPEESEKLKAIDLAIKTSIELKDWDALRKAVEQRGKLLAPYVNSAFAGKIGQEKEGKMTAIKNLAKFAYSFLGMLPLYKTMFFGDAYKKYIELARNNVKIDFLLPEFDTLVPAELILRFLGETAPANPSAIVNLRSTTHNSSALNWQGLTAALSKL